MNAQLKVLSNGKVGIGTDNPQYGLLEIGKSGVNNGLAIYDSLLTTPPLRLYSSGDLGFLNFNGESEKGITIKKDGRIGLGYNKSIYPTISPYINVYTRPSNPVGAFIAHVNFPFEYGDVVTIMSGKKTDMAYVVRSGTLTSNEIVYYARGDGEVYAKGSFLTASDGSYKDNVANISNGLDKIKGIRGVTYTLKDQDNASLTQNDVERNISLDISSISKSSVSAEIINTIKAERSRKKAGFIAQELEEVFPEAVYTLPNGNKLI